MIASSFRYAYCRARYRETRLFPRSQEQAKENGSSSYQRGERVEIHRISKQDTERGHTNGLHRSERIIVF